MLLSHDVLSLTQCSTGKSNKCPTSKSSKSQRKLGKDAEGVTYQSKSSKSSNAPTICLTPSPTIDYDEVTAKPTGGVTTIPPVVGVDTLPPVNGVDTLQPVVFVDTLPPVNGETSNFPSTPFPTAPVTPAAVTPEPTTMPPTPFPTPQVSDLLLELTIYVEQIRG